MGILDYLSLTVIFLFGCVVIGYSIELGSVRIANAIRDLKEK